ncbi:RING-H2 finger A3A [Rhynchospora pubera]|uniref:RING-type E3 ubiquitin transferase n=1 Tax=Rhynchospora pubera TaxID=906938 RepID=A0AAV8F1P9_9POAL|nr:RING-H2 finger A3A [Rhynchospora pubera]KAJ4784526.1 RING-H2 finger A3A [Rhynchospora pubera]
MVTFNSSMESESSPPDLFSPSPPSHPGVPIAAVIAVGFFATSLVLTIYYVMVVKFWLHGRPRRQSNYMPPIFFTYDTEGGGVDPSVIKSIPVVAFKKGEEGEKMKSLSIQECAVCLADFQEKESIKVLPGCSHAFHIDCIDTWLQFNANCPMCRSVITSSSLAQLLHGHAGQPEMEARGDERHEGDVASINENSVGRSFSMDWFSERRIKRGEASGSSAVNGDASGRFMRLVQSFRLGRSSRNAVLPIQMEP